jgi:hypothetical protein
MSPNHSKLCFSVMLIILTMLNICCVGGCRYERIVSRSSLISGLDGSESKIPEKRVGRELPDFLRTPEEGIRVENEDGSVTLYAKSIRQMMAHLTSTIQNGERDLFVEQVLSQVTKDEFYERGFDPATAFDELTRRQRDVFRLFYFMPMGEYTPGLFMQNVGRNMFRLEVSRAVNSSLYWKGVDAVFENGNYRLRWFVH